MFHSASASSKGKAHGSARIHPYAQQLPIISSSKITQPMPLRAAVHQVLAHRSCSHSHDKSKCKSKSPSACRRRLPTSEISSLNLDGTYDDDNDMKDVPMQNIGPIQFTETSYAQDQNVKREDVRYPHENADVKQELLGTDRLPKYHSFDLALPIPIQWSGYATLSREHESCLDSKTAEYLLQAAIGTALPREQVQALLYPRLCVDSDSNIVDRFVTDCSKTSGRIYDRLSRKELPRIIPYAGEFVPRPVTGQVVDVFTGEVRKRCLYDDFRDRVARDDGPLEVTEDEQDNSYVAVSEELFSKV